MAGLRSPTGRVGLVLALSAVLAIGSGCASRGEESSPLVPEGEPLWLPPARQASTHTYMEVGVVLEEPPPNMRPAIDHSMAERFALGEGVPGDPTIARATLALFTAESLSIERRPAWVVEFRGACVPWFGQTPSGGSNRVSPEDFPGMARCFSNTFSVVVDAESGAFLNAYSDRTGPDA